NLGSSLDWESGSNSRSLNRTVGHRLTGPRRITGIFEKPGDKAEQHLGCGRVN
ncbi:unnamed protein product, partial [Tetraodon nigroviridis]